MNNKYIKRINYFIKEYKYKVKSVINREKIKLNKDTKKVYIFLAADYANLGDVAITYAQREYIKNVLPEYEVIEIPCNKTYNLYQYLKKNIKKEDIITVVGGGNLGNIYDGIEEMRRMVIKEFKNNQIISFPQTIDFSEDISGRESLRRTKKIYSKHSNLTLFAREKNSYDKMKKIFNKNRVFLVPDIVMYLKGKIEENDDNGTKIGICIRNDKEKLMKTDVEKEIIKKYSKGNIELIKTHIGDENLIYENRYEELFKLIEKIRNLKILITDRLHGMIFCYITKTPCIVFDNGNHKVKGVYNKWLKECNYIKMLDEKDIGHIEEHIEKLTSIEKNDINSNEYFKKIEEVLNKKKKGFN